MHRGSGRPGFTQLNSDYYGALVSEDDWLWQFVSAINIENYPMLLNVHNESKDGFNSSISGLVYHDFNADGEYDVDDSCVTGFFVSKIQH